MQEWTTQQRQAIEARGGTLLVSAAAGSGKTAVLVERIVARITDAAHPCDADRLLVVTFTNAAAAEMRARLAARLRLLADETPRDANLRRQQLLLQHAHISTIHAFCLELLRTHFEKLDIPPDFRIADENETRLLLADALGELMEEGYTPGDGQGDFIALTEMFGAGRDDARLTDTALRLYDFLRSLADPEGWMDDKLLMYETDEPLAQTPWGKAARAYAAEALENEAETLRAALRGMQSSEVLAAAYTPAFSSLLAQVERAGEIARAGGWDELVSAVQAIVFERLGAARNVEDTALRDRLKAARDTVKKNIETLRGGLLACTEAQVRADCVRLLPAVRALFALVRALDVRFYAKKKEKGILDFGDLERLTLRLLLQNGQPTETARAVAAQFEEVLVDEYQDVNPAQDAIFRAVSRDGGNLFMVGDVKQSIYRFRKATPELFIEKKNAYAPYDGGCFPARIVLGRNFRSRAGVADAVNFLFGRLMSRRFGGIDYGEEERMIPAAAYFERPQGGADACLRLLETAETDEEDDNTALEAQHIAGMIADMLREGYAVQGKDGAPRPATARDFCILLRGANRQAQTYVDALTAAGLPAYADVAGGYLGTYEVAVLLSLLRVLDNPLQDIPLLSVLLSPVFGFTPDDVAALRLAQPQGRLYTALLAAARHERVEAGDPKGQGGRFAAFVSLLDELRTLAAVLPADELILRVYERTGFVAVCSAMPGGAVRRANLRLLLDYARDYESAGFRGLAGFVRFIDRVAEDADLAPASAVSESADVVRVMSIHKSKGLEFPVCIVAGCGRRFNRDDTRRPTLFHPEYGFGCWLRDEKLGCRYTTLPREVLRAETERASLAEEMRILYVALTRAKEKLICVAAVPSAEKAVQAAAGLLWADGSVSPFAAMRAQSACHWLLAGLMTHPSAGALRALAGLEELPVQAAKEPVEIGIFSAAGQVPAADAAAAAHSVPAAPPDAALVAEIERRIAFVYPRKALSRLPSKLAVSEIAEAVQRRRYSARRPSFLEKGLNPAQKGTALHAFMQRARLETLNGAQNVAEEARRLTESGALRAEEAAAVDVGAVLAFLASPLWARIQNAEKVWKELRFNIALPPAELAALQPGALPAENLPPDAPDVVLQGMADLIFLEKGQYYILDYKTDHADADELRARYAGQVRLYARAAEQIFGVPVAGCYLYGFARGVTVAL